MTCRYNLTARDYEYWCVGHYESLLTVVVSVRNRLIRFSNSLIRFYVEVYKGSNQSETYQSRVYQTL